VRQVGARIRWDHVASRKNGILEHVSSGTMWEVEKMARGKLEHVAIRSKGQVGARGT
jgi:hypothetical protein